MTSTKPPRHIKGGYIDPKTLPKGPNGHALCRQCGVEVKPPRRTFCSDKCVENWTIRTGSRAAKYVRRRDKGRCAICGLDCAKLERELRKLEKSFWEAWYATKPAREKGWWGRAKAALAEHVRPFKEAHSIPPHRRGRLWDIDHIVPVVEGGGSSGLENLQTMCIPCHQAKTSKLAAKRAQERRAKIEAP